jgi:hypothetical protein
VGFGQLRDSVFEGNMYINVAEDVRDFPDLR